MLSIMFLLRLVSGGCLVFVSPVLWLSKDSFALILFDSLFVLFMCLISETFVDVNCEFVNVSLSERLCSFDTSVCVKILVCSSIYFTSMFSLCFKSIKSSEHPISYCSFTDFDFFGCRIGFCRTKSVRPIAIIFISQASRSFL